MSKKASNSFTEQLEALESLVETMEAGELSLDDSLKAFEKGVKLVQNCRKTLDKAQQKVDTIMEQIEFDDE